jgi:hypothetical protein
MRNSTWVNLLLITIISHFVVACYARGVQAPHLAQNLSYDESDHDAAANQVAKFLKKKKSDVGLLMDLCAYHHYAGNYERSNQACQKAVSEAEARYTLSIREQVGAKLTNDTAISFQGDEFERLFLHVIGMLNYAALNQVQSALVEARKLDNKVSYFKNHPGPNPSRYKDDALGRYISGLLYEANGEPNDAFIDFRKSIRGFETTPGINTPRALPQDAMRTAKRHGMIEEYQAIKSQFTVQEKPHPLTSEHGEVIVVFENGYAPYKIQKNFLPFHLERSSTVNTARVKSLKSGQVADSQHVRNIGLQSYERHQERLAHIKQRSSSKKTVTRVLSMGAGALIFILSGGQSGAAVASATACVLSSLQAADLRGWHTLPAQIDIARLRLKSGKHDLAVKLYGHYGTELYRGVVKDVVVRPGKRTWVIQKLP